MKAKAVAESEETSAEEAAKKPKISDCRNKESGAHLAAQRKGEKLASKKRPQRFYIVALWRLLAAAASMAAASK